MDQQIGSPDHDDNCLYAVHVCNSCGHETRRSEMDPKAIISGVVVCPVCSDAGALNVVIRSQQDKKLPKRSAD